MIVSESINLLKEIFVFDFIRIMLLMFILLVLYMFIVDLIYLILFFLLGMGVLIYHLICKFYYHTNW